MSMSKEASANVGDYSDSALLCFPAELYGVKYDGKRHVTLLYLPEVTATPYDIAKALLDNGYWAHGLLYGANTYREAAVHGAGAFGVNKDIPVLTFRETFLRSNHEGAAYCLKKAGISYSMDFDFNPHMTVSLPEALRPVSKVLLRPLELWYHGTNRYLISPDGIREQLELPSSLHW